VPNEVCGRALRAAGNRDPTDEEPSEQLRLDIA
jgi:hypothetical protein